MLQEIDRLQLAVPDTDVVANIWKELLGAEPYSEDRVNCLGARRTSLRVGTGIVEILEPDGTGIVADAVASRGSHLFSAGVSTLDLSGLQAELPKNIVLENDQLFIAGNDIGIPGLRLVVSQHETRPAVGDLDFFYESTLLTENSVTDTAKVADVFKLDAQEFVPINHQKFGYGGTLTLFNNGKLHRFEIVSPFDAGKTMGRYFSKMGPVLYMCFAETKHMLRIEQRVKNLGLGITVSRPDDRSDDKPADSMWLHHKTLGGIMLGLSRPTMGWSWSGSPVRVEKVD